MQGPGVAQEGYKFLLRDAHSQLWVLLRRYIANAEQRSGALLHVGMKQLLRIRAFATSCLLRATERDSHWRLSCN